jgi:2-polyprenyl-3-methyl-5-hydroxy-6-metoxy-1,4-benzoquinol methylase
MIYLICGPSGAGKSSFYTSGAFARMAGESALPLIFPNQIEQGGVPPPASVIHYNMMRPMQFMPGMATAPAVAMNDRWSYDLDPAWKPIVTFPGRKRAYVVVASIDELRRRATTRPAVEPDLRATDGPYPNAFWSAAYDVANIGMIYSEFAAELARAGIEATYVVAKDGDFVPIDGGEVHAFLRAEAVRRYTADEISALIGSPKFEYQRISLPYGLATQGQDRSTTAERIFPKSLHGASVLDIGSALGFFCFEAERRGASKVVGLEPRESRHEAAVVLHEILGSRVELRPQGILDFSSDEQFDYVLLLNVIHHLKEPFRVLRRCAELCKGALIVEFPQLDDPIFSRVATASMAELQNLPLIGVSSMSVDQTFIFTPKALERVLMDHDRLFDRFDCSDSPMPCRKLMIFHKHGK